MAAAEVMLFLHFITNRINEVNISHHFQGNKENSVVWRHIFALFISAAF